MKQGRLHLRLDKPLEEAIKAYAQRHGVTVTELVSRYFKLLLDEEKVQQSLALDAEQI